MHATDRLADERTFYDRQALARAAHYPHPGVLSFDDDDFLDHETWVRPAFARPGGVAVFCEPWGGNPLLEWARRRLPYPGKHHTRDERPLRKADLAPLRAAFPSLEVEGYQLLGMARRVLGPGRLARGLDWCDAR